MLDLVGAGCVRIGFEEVIGHNQQHGCCSEEDRKGEEVAIGDHLERYAMRQTVVTVAVLLQIIVSGMRSLSSGEQLYRENSPKFTQVCDGKVVG